jgi:aryl-alcohol dehydrogenase-like predicted oxidoreductase
LALRAQQETVPFPAGDQLFSIAAHAGAAPTQVVLAWMLKRLPVTMLIPGTSSIAHLEENVATCGIALLEVDMDALERLATVAG